MDTEELSVKPFQRRRLKNILNTSPITSFPVGRISRIKEYVTAAEDLLGWSIVITGNG